MKIELFVVVTLFIMNSCKTQVETVTDQVIFGIHETVKSKNIPPSVYDKLGVFNIQFEKNKELPIIGYIQKKDTINFENQAEGNSTKPIRTVYTVDQEGLYNAIVMIKSTPVIVNSDIARTKKVGLNVEIRFTMKGAKKWADVIAENQGNNIAFVIDNLVYSLPVINGRIDNGSALISGLNDESLARRISESLNNSIPE